MTAINLDLEVGRLGECKIPSRMTNTQFVSDDSNVLYHSRWEEIEAHVHASETPPAFEIAGPREKIFFDPSKLKCGIVTCGGLCPGLNDVIRAIVLGLNYHYGVKTVFGFRYGFEGLSPRYAHTPFELTPAWVADIHHQGGTILGSSRGPQDIGEMVDTMEQMNVGILFTIGGDGTLRGAQAIAEETAQRGLKIGVIGIPKTIDNDISFIDVSFGFETAVSEARSAIYAAKIEAAGFVNGIGLVKLMGRESGFIAANATLVNPEVDFCLVPEVPFTLEGFLSALQQRVAERNHAVVVVGEGAGQNLIPGSGERDPSGNIRFGDIGIFLRDRIREHYKDAGLEANVRYIDPSYMIRSTPANPHDSGFCLVLGHNAVHAGMAGRTNMMVGNWKGDFTHVPIRLAVSQRKRIDSEDRLWNNVLAVTGQPRDM
jgi:6-phosphofructokinase 1